MSEGGGPKGKRAFSGGIFIVDWPFLFFFKK